MVRNWIRVSPVVHCSCDRSPHRGFRICRLPILTPGTGRSKVLAIPCALGGHALCNHLCLSRRESAVVTHHFSFLVFYLTTHVLTNAHAMTVDFSCAPW